MSKRFTATEKWEDPWYRALSPEEKCAWQYLCDKCDVAGCIQLDRSLADFQIGLVVNWDSFLARSGGRVVALDNGYLWIVRFVEFQYGTLSETARPHQQVIALLKKRGLLERVLKGIQKSRKGYLGTLKEKEKDKDQDQDTDQDQEQDSLSKKGGAGGKTLSLADQQFEQFWAVFPRGRKGGKKAARAAWDKAIREAAPGFIIAAAEEYAESPVGRGEFVKGPCPWLNQGCWDDDRASWQRADHSSNHDPRGTLSAAKRYLGETDE